LFIERVLLPIAMAVITLTTDFGWRDGYVGAMKGVIARLAPGTTTVDIAHDIPPGDIAHAAWVVRTATREFPPETVHVVVVDPGVGTARRAVVIAKGADHYVGPDNGVFAYVAPPGDEARELPIPDTASKTFHGRDVFAVAAAALARGEPPTGTRVELVGAVPWGRRLHGQGRIVHIDRFGNLISDLPPDEAGPAIAIHGHTLVVHDTFASVAPHQLVAYVGSARTIEVAVRDGSAQRLLHAERGLPVLPAAAPVGLR
jgi:S-adenosylmethionine hydrolase